MKKVLPVLVIWVCVGLQSAAQTTDFLTQFNAMSPEARREAKLVKVDTNLGPLYELFYPLQPSPAAVKNDKKKPCPTIECR